MLDYYATPHVRTLCHLAKQGDQDALLKIAEVLASRIGSNDVITPVPNRKGESGVMRVVCDHIARLTGCSVWDGIKGIARASQYESKKHGQTLSGSELGFSLTAPPPVVRDRHLVIDVIKDTGTTLNAALALLPDAKPLPFAVVDKLSEKNAHNRIEQLGPLSTEGLVSALTMCESENEAFSLVYKAVAAFPLAEDALIQQLKRQYPFTQHAGLRDGMSKGFISAFKLSLIHPLSPPTPRAELMHLLSMSQHFSEVIEKHEAGFHFEEGGCWGFAAALYDHVINHGVEPAIVWSQEQMHCYVKMDGMLFDHQGASPINGRNLLDVSRSDIASVAERNGLSRHEFDADLSWAGNILSDAASFIENNVSDQPRYRPGR